MFIDVFFFSCSTIHSSYFSSEVITYNQLVQLKPEPKSIISGWIKGAFRGGKKEMQESIHQKLDFILTTAPIWDRCVAIYALKFDVYIVCIFLYLCVYCQILVDNIIKYARDILFARILEPAFAFDA
jgi:hypothetical protein